MERGSQEASDATRALPDAMTAALSAALQKADRPSMLPSTNQTDGQPAFQVSSLANESQQQLRLLVSEELAQAVQQISSAQVCSEFSVSISSLPFQRFSDITICGPYWESRLGSFLIHAQVWSLTGLHCLPPTSSR